jgi:predicted RNase H-like HicB family nuclease
VHGYRAVYDDLPANWAAYTPDPPVILVTGPSCEDCEQQMASFIPGHLAFLEQDAIDQPVSARSSAPAARVAQSEPGAARVRR